MVGLASKAASDDLGCASPIMGQTPTLQHAQVRGIGNLTVGNCRKLLEISGEDRIAGKADDHGQCGERVGVAPLRAQFGHTIGDARNPHHILIRPFRDVDESVIADIGTALHPVECGPNPPCVTMQDGVRREGTVLPLSIPNEFSAA